MAGERATPWDYMGPAEVEILGSDIVLDPAEQARWSRAIIFGTLPYMWIEKAGPVRDLMFGKLDLRPGDRVLLIGECLDACGFSQTINAAIGAGGELVAIDIAPDARAAYLRNDRGRDGGLATWRWEFTTAFPDDHFDAIAVFQAVQHTDSWPETSTELLRVLKFGRPIVLAEMTFGPNLKHAAALDIHLQSWLDKIFARTGFALEDINYVSPEHLMASFDGKVDGAETFCWRGVELFWGHKPASAQAPAR